jgi:hypothetical protein
VIQNHSHRAGADLGRELVGRLACHGSTFSGVGASDQPGAVQYAWKVTFEQIPEGRAHDEWSPWDGIW